MKEIRYIHQRFMQRDQIYLFFTASFVPTLWMRQRAEFWEGHQQPLPLL